MIWWMLSTIFWTSSDSEGIAGRKFIMLWSTKSKICPTQSFICYPNLSDTVCFTQEIPLKLLRRVLDSDSVILKIYSIPNNLIIRSNSTNQLLNNWQLIFDLITIFYNWPILLSPLLKSCSQKQLTDWRNKFLIWQVLNQWSCQKVMKNYFSMFCVGIKATRKHQEMVNKG